MGETIMNAIISIPYSLILYNILKELLTLKGAIWVKPLLFLIVLSTSDVIIYPEEITGSVGILVEFLIIVLLCCSKNYVRNLSCILVFYPIIVSINYLTHNMGLLMWKYLFHQDMVPIAEIALNSLFIALRIPFWYSVYRFIRKRITDIAQSLTSKMWFAIDTVCIASFIGIITIIYNSDLSTSYITYPACIACIITSLGTCYLSSYISQTMKTAMELQILKYQQSYYEEIENNQQKIHKLRHDMKNHLNVIYTFLRNQETEQASEYLSTLSDGLSTELQSFCQNSIVNAVLNTKYLLAAEHQIKCNFQLDLENDIGIDRISLCSLVANTLDNAIEACMQIPDLSMRSISLKARCFNGFFSYEINNTRINTIIKKNGKIQTNKNDPSAHGYGLQNIIDIVNRYQGTIEIAYTDQDFTVTTLIPIHSTYTR